MTLHKIAPPPLLALLILVLVAAISSGAEPDGTQVGAMNPAEQEATEAIDDDWGDDEDEVDTDARGFLFTEVVLSALFSRQGVMGFPPGDSSMDHFELLPRPPGNSIGVDYVRTVTAGSWINQSFLGDLLPVTALALHPRLVYTRVAEGDDDWDRVEFAPQDFWVRFNPGRRDRLALRIGQFAIPYGVNPPLAPRQRAILPVEALDLGFKWDWGIALKGPAGRYDWEVAATIGSGESLHSPDLGKGFDRESWVLSGRFGTPTYVDRQFGLSFLVGDVPTIRGPRHLDDESISRYRISLDGLYKYGTFLLSGAQLTWGQDGYAGDEELVEVSDGETADVLGARLWADWILPSYQDVRLGLQFETIIRDLATEESDETAVTFEISSSVTNWVTIKLDYRHEFRNAMGMTHDVVFFILVFYGR